MISDEAVEAALDAWGGCPVGSSPKEQVTRILEAAAQHMLIADAWAEGHGVGRTDEWGIEPNPYRSQTRRG